MLMSFYLITILVLGLHLHVAGHMHFTTSLQSIGYLQVPVNSSRLLPISTQNSSMGLKLLHHHGSPLFRLENNHFSNVKYFNLCTHKIQKMYDKVSKVGQVGQIEKFGEK